MPAQLIDVLALEPSELTDEQRAHALRVFCALLSTQEHKTDAIAAGASQPVTRLVIESKNDEVRTRQQSTATTSVASLCC